MRKPGSAQKPGLRLSQSLGQDQAPIWANVGGPAQAGVFGSEGGQAWAGRCWQAGMGGQAWTNTGRRSVCGQVWAGEHGQASVGSEWHASVVPRGKPKIVDRGREGERGEEAKQEKGKFDADVKARTCSVQADKGERLAPVRSQGSALVAKEKIHLDWYRLVPYCMESTQMAT